MTSCDYNGWNDAPEDERECMDRYRELSLGMDALDVQRSPGVALQHSPVVRLCDAELAE